MYISNIMGMKSINQKIKIIINSTLSTLCFSFPLTLPGKVILVVNNTSKYIQYGSKSLTLSLQKGLKLGCQVTKIWIIWLKAIGRTMAATERTMAATEKLRRYS